MRARLPPHRDPRPRRAGPARAHPGVLARLLCAEWPLPSSHPLVRFLRALRSDDAEPEATGDAVLLAGIALIGAVVVAPAPVVTTLEGVEGSRSPSSRRCTVASRSRSRSRASCAPPRSGVWARPSRRTPSPCVTRPCRMRCIGDECEWSGQRARLRRVARPRSVCARACCAATRACTCTVPCRVPCGGGPDARCVWLGNRSVLMARSGGLAN